MTSRQERDVVRGGISLRQLAKEDNMPMTKSTLSRTKHSSRHLSERRTNLFNSAWKKTRPCPLSQFSTATASRLFSHHCLKRMLFEISVPSVSEKGDNHWAIVKLSDANSLAC
ncbi:hypothetical protein AVEN_182795-1 [Araneus ventricosus]|uniref:Uncharacterized protein n=1 Tax=Araneus ventricosus TaxID=182803 RepID=A0A4Y2HQW9_ARAVE|nr:hypothetical protein AVEN_182795-1 [Araneus ventricosus]